ncbi:MAG: molybdopterin-binding protein, partial [Xanthomonadales bacterium]|nr:molybdopterin-binding protein [Xanthomonadales bacterium]
ERMLSALSAAARQCDLIVTAGGVSMGEADFLPSLLHQHGRIHFWRVRMKPGLPVLFGEIDGTPLLGLPGNPVSAAVGFMLFARAGMAAMQGRAVPTPWRGRLAQAIQKRHQRCEFVRCHASTDADGTLLLRPLTRQGSGQLTSLSGANALARIPEAMLDPPAGSVLDTWLLDGGDSV